MPVERISWECIAVESGLPRWSSSALSLDADIEVCWCGFKKEDLRGEWGVLVSHNLCS